MSEYKEKNKISTYLESGERERADALRANALVCRRG